MRPVPDEIDADTRHAIVRAYEAAGLKRDGLADLMGISGPQLSQQLAGQGQLSFRRLTWACRQDENFRRYLMAELPVLFQTDDTDALASLFAFGLRILEHTPFRMARASLDSAEQERKRA
jgi:hypothetical protein